MKGASPTAGRRTSWNPPSLLEDRPAVGDDEMGERGGQGEDKYQRNTK
jgi:hypothetical protein